MTKTEVAFLGSWFLWLALFVYMIFDTGVCSR